MHSCRPLLVLLALSLTSLARAQAPETAPPPPVTAAPTTPPPTDTELPPRRTPPHPRQHRSFVPMVVGLGMFVGGYVFSAAVGLELKLTDSDVCNNCKYGPRLFIPVIGPWLLLPDANGAAGKALTAIMGVIQDVGLVLAVYGMVRFSVTGESANDEARAERFDVAFTPLPGGGYTGMRLRW